MLAFLLDPHIWLAFVTLTALELVLGIDNIIFISILVDKLPPQQREKARRLGLFLALFMRVGLLMGLSWIVGLTAPLFSAAGIDFTGRMLILASGGAFLVWKSGGEIRGLFAGDDHQPNAAGKARLGLAAAILQITVIDIVFSLDSIITAVGMVDEVPVMVAAVVVSVGLMMAFAGGIGRFVAAYPTIKMLALAFLVLVGTALMAEGVGYTIPKGYIYTAMGFALAVELLNLRLRHQVADAVLSDESARVGAGRLPRRGSASRM
ncbi:MAG: TerC family protein [Herminiimonas sp.]|nr:TerC family protein [Herminiimonas sp.]